MGSFPNTDFPRNYGPIVAGPATLNGGLLELLGLISNTFTTDLPMVKGWVMYRQFTVDADTYISSVVWSTGTNIPTGVVTAEVGIYNENGTRLATTGTVTMATPASQQSSAFTSAVTLKPGCYYIGWVNRDWTSGGGAGIAPFRGTAALNANKHRAMGNFEQFIGASTALPATATFAVMSTNATVGLPIIVLLGRN
tara:strand:- start:604 stop:1191 length:588 start_codon:yes stop_codon:yes gene_type:complete